MPCRTGVVSTFACKGAEQGFPRGSVIEHVIDEQGRPIFSLSTLSAHLHDLRNDGRCSFTVMQPGFRVCPRKLQQRCFGILAARLLCIRHLYTLIHCSSIGTTDLA